MSEQIALAERQQDALARLRAIPESERYHEILRGRLVDKPRPSLAHGFTQGKLGALLAAPGWWLGLECEFQLGGEVFYVQPDVSGIRKERMPVLTDETPCLVRPDWIGEVVSPSHEARDKVLKRRGYAAAGVPNLWLVCLRTRTLTALTLRGVHYEVERVAHAGERVRLPPFESVELFVEYLFLPIEEGMGTKEPS